MTAALSEYQRIVQEHGITRAACVSECGKYQPGRGFLCWGVTAYGRPRHPLMVAYSTPLVPW